MFYKITPKKLIPVNTSLLPIEAVVEASGSAFTVTCKIGDTIVEQVSRDSAALAEESAVAWINAAATQMQEGGIVIIIVDDF